MWMNFCQFLQSNRHILKSFFCTGHVGHLSSFTAPNNAHPPQEHFWQTETSLEPQFQLSGDTAGHFLLVGEKHWSVDSFLCGTLSAENEKEEDQLLTRCNCFTLLNKDVTRWFIPSLLRGPWVALRGCFTLQQSGPGDCLQLPKPHCLAGRARGYRPFCCPHAHVYQVVLGRCLTIHTLSTPSEPRSPVHLTARALRRRQHLTPGACSILTAGLCAVTPYLRCPLGSPPSPQPHWLSRWSHRAGVLWQIHLQRTGQGRRDTDSAGEANTVTVCQEMAWEHNPDSACPVAGTVRPRASKPLTRESPWGQLAPWHPENQCEWSGNFTPRMAASALCQDCLFPRFAHPRRKHHILPGETIAPISTGQPGGASVLELHMWRNSSHTPPTFQHLITAGVWFKSFAICHVFSFPKHKNQQQCRISTPRK